MLGVVSGVHGADLFPGWRVARTNAGLPVGSSAFRGSGGGVGSGVARRTRTHSGVNLQKIPGTVKQYWPPGWRNACGFGKEEPASCFFGYPMQILSQVDFVVPVLWGWGGSGGNVPPRCAYRRGCPVEVATFPVLGCPRVQATAVQNAMALRSKTRKESCG